MMENTSEIVMRTPVSDLDFWSDQVIAEPYPYYKALREIGPVVWLDRYGCWAAVQHKEVRTVLFDTDTFTSAQGLAMNAAANRNVEGTMILSDDPDHKRLRRVFQRPLLPGTIGKFSDRLRALAETRVDELVAKQKFDGVTQLAHFLPLTVVTDLLGLTEEGKSKMLDWAAALFNTAGPEGNPRTTESFDLAVEAVTYLTGLDRADLDPEGWGADLFRAADRGEISVTEARNMLIDYTGPALDTTINGLSGALMLFAKNPEQWDRLRADPKLVNKAIDEALRLESPIRAFSRVATRDIELGGAAVREGDRILVVYASANRDERRYSDPEQFDITRDARDHVAFGYGMHLCAGMHLAKLEIRTVLEVLIERVARFHLLSEERDLHNTLRGLSRLMLRVDPA